MTVVRGLLAVFTLIGAVIPVVGFSETVYLKEMPKEGDIPFGKIVYVDDRKCPKGEVKEVTGGSREKAIPRQVRCVKRPGPSPAK